jgi:hypothetical protein
MKTRLALFIVAIASAVAAIGYAYNTYKASEAKNLCQSISTELEAFKAEGNKLSTDKVQAIKDRLVDCKVALQAVPFKGEDIQRSIIKVDDVDKQITAMMPMLVIAEGLQNAFKPAPSTSTSSATQPGQPAPSTTKFENLTPCEQLDAIAKAGKSVADYLDASDETAFKTYQGAIKTSCTWHQSQLDVAIAKWQARQPKSAQPAPIAPSSSGSFLGNAMTGEPVYLISASRVNTTGGQVTYQIGSDVVSGYVNCKTNTINTAAYGSFSPQSQAIQRVIDAVCR